MSELLDAGKLPFSLHIEPGLPEPFRTAVNGGAWLATIPDTWLLFAGNGHAGYLHQTLVMYRQPNPQWQEAFRDAHGPMRQARTGPFLAGQFSGLSALDAAISVAHHYFHAIHTAVWGFAMVAGAPSDASGWPLDVPPVEVLTKLSDELHSWAQGQERPPSAEIVASLRWEARAAAGAPELSGPRRRLHIDAGQILLDGRPVPLNMTSDRCADALVYLGYLIEAGGNYVSDGDVNRAETDRKGGRPGVRWDKLRKKLPQRVRALIETHPRKGSRLLLAPGRK
jgi:hypothetical protein